MSEIKKTPIEEARGVAGFLIPEVAMPSHLVDYFGLNSSIQLSVRGAMVKIEDETFFKVEEWRLK